MFKGYKTYAGIAIIAVATLFGWLGIGGEAEATEFVTEISQAIGVIIATYGRYAARP